MNKARSFCLFLLIWFLQANTGLFAVNLDAKFKQSLDKKFWSELKSNPEKERAVFLEYGSTDFPLITYLRRHDKSGFFILRGNLPQDCEKFFARTLASARKQKFAPLKSNGEPLYRYGTVFKGTAPGNPAMQWQYVPHRVQGQENQCFVSDLGYFELRFKPGQNIPAQALIEFLHFFSSGRLSLSKEVRLNRYYLFKEDFWGPVDYFAAASLQQAMEISAFMPTHKLTMNKHVNKWQKKHKLDLKLVFELLAEEDYLLSQDNRLKLGMVSGKVRLNLSRIAHTDIGSGQNQLVFLSIGPGINYFDDPWLQPRRNLPCPRLIFNQAALALSQLQVYPTYSIAPPGKGEKRLQAINRFQTILSDPDFSEVPGRLPAWLGFNLRKTMFEIIEDAVCEYGLTNDSPDLTPGFKILEQSFNGNLINNEIRIYQGIPLHSFLCAVIVPPGSESSYQNRYAQEFLNRSEHWQFVAGTYFKDLFVSAPTPDDKGFRAAWLGWHMQFSHPTLARILELARTMQKSSSEIKISESLGRIIAREKTAFFKTAYRQKRQELETEKLELWSAYLESRRFNRQDMRARLAEFINFHNRLKELLK